LHQISSHVLPAVVGISDQNGSIVASGVIVNPRGYIVTAWHAISQLPVVNAQVRTQNGLTSYQADVTEVRPEHDLVLLKLKTNERFLYMPVPANTEQLWTDQVAAFGMGGSGQIIHKPGTMGAFPVSLDVANLQLNQLYTTKSVYSWEQTGGPLVDMRAQLVGINLALKNTSGVVEGYTVPSQFIVKHFNEWLPKSNGSTVKKKI
jgi:serine protease Do